MDKALLNWAGNLAYAARALHFPASVDQLQELVRTSPRIRALGTRHSFSSIADTDAELVSLARLNRVIGIDSEAMTVTVEGGISYGQLCPWLDEQGFALPNLASLPHIGVAGAVATATHGSGVGNRNLAAPVRSLDVVTANGEIVTFNRGDDGFEGAVVALSALGIVTSLTLDVEPSYEIRQSVFLDLPARSFADNFEAIMSAAYSVSAFTLWRGDKVDQVWLKSRDDTAPPTAFFSARPAIENMHPIAGLDATPCTPQLGLAGPWHERLPHFRMAFTPSAGAELQSEYFVPRAHAVDAYRALRRIETAIAPYLLVSEIRTVAADDFWLSPAYGEDVVGFHCTWKPDWPSVRQVLPQIEAALAPFSARPHWAKLATMDPAIVRSHYRRLPDFRALASRHDPDGKFRNAFVDRYLFDSN